MTSSALPIGMAARSIRCSSTSVSAEPSPPICQSATFTQPAPSMISSPEPSSVNVQPIPAQGKDADEDDDSNGEGMNDDNDGGDAGGDVFERAEDRLRMCGEVAGEWRS